MGKIREEILEMGEELCFYCKYEDKECDEFPCTDCKQHIGKNDHWVSKTQEVDTQQIPHNEGALKMKKFEKYSNEFEIESDCDFVRKRILKTDNCNSIKNCDKCRQMVKEWMLEEYVEPEIDWLKVPIDTPVLVRNKEDENWKLRYFVCYLPEKPNGYPFPFFVFNDGLKQEEAENIVFYRQCKLADEVDATPYLKE